MNKVVKANLTTEDYLNILETLFETDIYSYSTNDDIKLLLKKSIINLIIKSEDYEILLLKFITLWQNNNRGIYKSCFNNIILEIIINLFDSKKINVVNLERMKDFFNDEEHINIINLKLAFNPELKTINSF